MGHRPAGDRFKALALGQLIEKLVPTTPEQLAQIESILGGGGEVASGEWPVAEPRFVFRRTSRLWEVIFAGGGRFHLENTLGARYLDYLLHHPNDPISAFDLEVAIEPEKGEARARTSIQPTIDPRARREYERALGKLRADQESAQEAEERAEVSRLDGEIEALELALNERGGTENTDERARGNVRRALGVVIGKLLKGGEHEGAFAEHLRSHLSTGYECLYSQPEGKIWA
jgi:hypothetical protein